MYKLMIVDDDKIIRQSIIQLIDWERSGFILSGEGFDGEDALEKIRENPPNLVITDIFMPVKNGIELFEEVRKEFPNIIFLMLSNYDDFSYVRSALKIGAFDYLLKFELNQEMIHKLLNGVRKELDTQYLSYEIEKRSPLREEGPEKVLAGNAGLNICGILVAGYSRRNSPEHKSFLEALPHELCCPYDHILFTNLHQENYLFLCYSKDVNVKEAQMELMGKLNWENPSLETGDIIAVSNFIRGREQFVKSYENCRRMLGCSFYDCSTNLIAERNFKPFYKAPSLEKYINEIPAIIKALQTNCIAESTENLNCLLKQMAEDHLEPRQGLMVLEHLTHEMNEFCVSFEVPLPDQFEEGLLPGNYFARFWNIREIEEGYKKLVSVFELTHCTGEQQVSNEIALSAIQFISKNFNKPICLQDVADHVNVNKNHLCRVLKKHAGSSFNILLNQMRIKYSKQLLRNTGMNLETVALSSGFSDYRYFKKVFVNSTGVFPTEYRENQVE